jgi:hypothetical protein
MIHCVFYHRQVILTGNNLVASPQLLVAIRSTLILAYQNQIMLLSLQSLRILARITVKKHIISGRII